MMPVKWIQRNASAFTHDELAAMARYLWGEARLPELMPLLRRRSSGFDKHILLEMDDKIIGHAKMFHRDIDAVDMGEIFNVLALSCVFVAPEYRGKGWGSKIVKGAFEYVDNGYFKLAMWQTMIPAFYERLGARRIENPIHDGILKETVMIYPEKFQLVGWIDVQGQAW